MSPESKQTKASRSAFFRYCEEYTGHDTLCLYTPNLPPPIVEGGKGSVLSVHTSGTRTASPVWSGRLQVQLNGSSTNLDRLREGHRSGLRRETRWLGRPPGFE